MYGVITLERIEDKQLYVECTALCTKSKLRTLTLWWLKCYLISVDLFLVVIFFHYTFIFFFFLLLCCAVYFCFHNSRDDFLCDDFFNDLSTWLKFTTLGPIKHTCVHACVHSNCQIVSLLLGFNFEYGF